MPSFVVLLRYVAPLAEVDALMRAHVAWLKDQHARGVFLAWGRRVPREGGVILARAGSREEVETLAAADPFVAGGVATAEVIEWTPSFVDAAVAGLDG